MADETTRPAMEDIAKARERHNLAWMNRFTMEPPRRPADAEAMLVAWVRESEVFDYAAARLRAEEEAERVPGSIVEHYGVGPEVETPEDAGEYPCAGGCGTMLEPPFAPGDTCGLCAAVDQFMAGKQPPTDPEARVRAMSDEEVERRLGKWVRPWRQMPPMGVWVRKYIALHGGKTAIYHDGSCRDEEGFPFDDVTGDTTTPEGRAECARRLLVHLLREEVARG